MHTPTEPSWLGDDYTSSLQKVIKQEAEYIARRRQVARLGPPGRDKEHDRPPAESEVKNLVGLALSGGGIRSATFNLGVLQALAKMGFLPWIDYLSTVSGGGYVGTCLTSLLSMRILTLPDKTKVWARPFVGQPDPLLEPLYCLPPQTPVEVVGQEWWYIHYTDPDNQLQTGWITEYPGQLAGSCLHTGLYLWGDPASQLDIVAYLPENTQITRLARWYKISINSAPPQEPAQPKESLGRRRRQNLAQLDKVLQQSQPSPAESPKIATFGWIQVEPDSPVRPECIFRPQFSKFPFNPSFNPVSAMGHDRFKQVDCSDQPGAETPAGAAGVAGQQKQADHPAKLPLFTERNPQIYHMRLKGNFIIPRQGFLTRDTIRAIGTILVGLSHMIFIFFFLFLGLATFHYVTAGALTSHVWADFGRTLRGLLAPPSPVASPLAAPATPTIEVAGQQFVIYLPPPPSSNAETEAINVLPATRPLTTTLKTPILPDWLPMVIFAAVPLAQLNSLAETETPDFILPSAYLIALLVGAIVAIISARELYRYYRSNVFRNWPGRAGLSRQEQMDRQMLYRFAMVVLFGVVIVSVGLKGADRGEPTTLLFWLWVPAIFMIGSWLTTALAYPIFFRGRSWNPEFRSIIAAWQGLNTYGVLLALVLAGLALPYYLSLGNLDGVPTGEPGNLWVWAMTALLSAASSYFLAKGGGASQASSLFTRLLRLPTGLRNGVLNLLVIILVTSLVILFGTLFERIPAGRGEALLYGLFGLGLGAVLLLTLGFGAVRKLFKAQLGPWWFQLWLSLTLLILFMGLLGLFQGGLYLWHVSYEIKLLGVFLIGLLAGLSLWLLTLYVNANRISLHYFYRDRLAEAFLKTETLTNQGEVKIVRDHSEMRIQEINPEACAAPYHLVVTALNLPGSEILTYKDRKSDHFIFSRYYCGSQSTGYLRTHLYRGGLTQVARVMAISGAAISSSLGYHTFLAQAFIMTMLNVRLGYWIDNPREYRLQDVFAKKWLTELLRPGSEGAFTAETDAFWPKYLWYELAGRADNRSRLINLSDGGHTDNLGLYPLLQRRCKLIIASDAGADPEYVFADLGRIIRQVYVEENIIVNIDLECLRPNQDTHFSSHHCAVGQIIYPGEPREIGWLIYLKPTLTGDEEGAVKSYWWNYALEKFPQQTTADQFYDDDQFEAYRRLGELTVEHTLQALKDHYSQSAPSPVSLIGDLLDRLLTGQSHHPATLIRMLAECERLKKERASAEASAGEQSAEQQPAKASGFFQFVQRFTALLPPPRPQPGQNEANLEPDLFEAVLFYLSEQVLPDLRRITEGRRGVGE